MSVRNQNWYDLQAARRYPLDDRSTGVDDAGQLMRDSILVDCHLRFPSTLGQYAYIQGITVAPQLVTIVFGVAADLDDPSPVTVAAVSLPRTTPQNVNHEVTPLIEGVAGWIVLGAGLAEEFVGRYSTPIQTLLAQRTARPYRPLPVPTLGKLGLAASLQNIVTLSAQSPLIVEQRTVAVDGALVQALVFELDTTLTINGQSPLQTYLGPCAQRPESNTCPKPTIQTLNGIAPDCNGNINLVFNGLTPYRFPVGGVDIATDVGLAEVCGAANNGDGQAGNTLPDNCGSTWEDPLSGLTPTITESESIPEAWPAVCASIPLCVNFMSGFAPNFDYKPVGDFIYVEQEAPTPCLANVASPPYTTHFVALSSKVFQPNILLYRNCVGAWANGRTISTELSFSFVGPSRNGGLVFNYVETYGEPTTYFLALIDGSRNAVRLLRFNGSALVEEHSVPFRSGTGVWYRLHVSPMQTGSSVIVTVAVEATGGSSQPISFSVPVSNYGAGTGQAGLYANRARTFFNHFKIEN